MIGWLLKRSLAFVSLWLVQRYARISLGLLKIRAAVCYVKGVQAARAAGAIALRAAGLIAIIAAGLVLLPAGIAVLVYGLGGGWVAICTLLIVTGALYVIVPLIILSRGMTEREWMRFFKVDDLVAHVTKGSRTQ